MTYFLHPGAEQDIADALDFYAEHAGPLVASRFLGEFERVANLLVEHPGFGTPAAKGRRVFPLRLFPYSVVYRSLEVGIRIIVVRHQHRKPGHGGSRAQAVPAGQSFDGSTAKAPAKATPKMTGFDQAASKAAC